MAKSSAAKPKYEYRKDYMAARQAFLVTFEAPSIMAKARMYLAADRRRLSYNSWVAEYVWPLIDKLMDEQEVPTDPKKVYRALADNRPENPLWKQLAKEGDEPLLAKRGIRRGRG